jgi:hypothetical protein
LNFELPFVGIKKCDHSWGPWEEQRQTSMGLMRTRYCTVCREDDTEVRATDGTWFSLGNRLFGIDKLIAKRKRKVNFEF